MVCASKEPVSPASPYQHKPRMSCSLGHTHHCARLCVKNVFASQPESTSPDLSWRKISFKEQVQSRQRKSVSSHASVFFEEYILCFYYNQEHGFFSDIFDSSNERVLYSVCVMFRVQGQDTLGVGAQRKDRFVLSSEYLLCLLNGDNLHCTLTPIERAFI